MERVNTEESLDLEDEFEIQVVVGGREEDIGTPPPLPPPRRSQKSHSYSWLSKISTINLDLCGTDLSQRIEVSCPNGGPSFKTALKRRKDENGVDVEDQKQFTLMSSSNHKLLTLDFSSDRKSFHIMEPDSDTFIAFFTVQGDIDTARVDIHNVIDDEVYYADPTDTPYRFVIKSEKGEEMGTISRPSPKWTQFVSGTMTLNFTGDEREGLTTREKAIVLGFLIALGVFGMEYWKRSSSGLLTFYLLSILLFSILFIFIYTKFTEGMNLHKNAHNIHKASLDHDNNKLT